MKSSLNKTGFSTELSNGNTPVPCQRRGDSELYKGNRFVKN